MRRLLRDEDGIALVLSLIVMAALAAGLTTVIIAGTSSGSTAVRASADQQAYNYAEAGVNSAMAALHAADVNALDDTVLPPPPPDAGAHRDDYDDGYVLWGGTFDSSTQSWHITSVGYAHNRSSVGMADRSRTLTATTVVQPSLTQPVNNAVWNYIYAWGTGGATNCDVDVANNVTVSAPLYIEGNLCLKNNARIAEVSNSPPTPANVVVKGKVQFSPGTGLGYSNAKISEAHLNTCGTSLTTVHNCTTSDPVYAKVFDRVAPGVTPPLPDYASYYSTASPGPSHPCDAATALNPPTWDNDGTLNLATNGSAGTLNLTPTQSYTCKTSSGELSWNATTKVLTISGVIYFDGNVSVTNGAINEYNGQATLYATGVFSLNGKMCGKRNAAKTDCDFAASGWNPNTEMLIVVAHGNDGLGNSVTFFNNARWQGGIYCQNTLNFNNNAVVEGPVLAGYVKFTNNVTATPFPVINTVPLGAPGNPNVYADPQPPVVTG